MSRFINPMARQGSASVAARAAAIKGWTRQALALDEHIVISISELTCTQPGCPPQITVALVLIPDAAFKITVHKPIVDVTENDVIEASRDPDVLKAAAQSCRPQEAILDIPNTKGR